jgi:hypothetical protein
MKTKVASVVAGIVNGGILSISPLIVHSSVLGSGNVNIVFYSKTFLLFNEGVYGENIEAAFAMLCGMINFITIFSSIIIIRMAIKGLAFMRINRK